MRKIREVLRLTHERKLSVRQVSIATGVGKTTVGEFVARAKVIGITWPIPSQISDAELEAQLFTPAGFHRGPTQPVPDCFKPQFLRLKARSGPKEALIAVAASMLTTAYHMLADGTCHQGPWP